MSATTPEALVTRSLDRRPLTTAEQALWYAQQLDPASPAYLCAHAVTLRGPVDVARLRAAVLAVTAAADNLHVTVAAAPLPAGGAARSSGSDADSGYVGGDDPATRGGDDAGDLCAVAHPPAGCPVHDLRDDPDPGARAAAWMRADATTAVPLDRPGLFAQALLVLPDRVVWYLRAHHLLLDGYGFTLLTDRVAAAYRDPAAAVAPFPPAARLVADAHRYRDSGRRAADGDHWHAHLAGRPAAASLSDVVAAPAVP
ncbi:MAG TPA: hypothetical protein VFY17_02945, partial [Pilimelia sp.]|nr:hypothetical protein [Pilimelia sp.]